MGDTFKALVLNQADDDFSAEFQGVALADLPDGASFRIFQVSISPGRSSTQTAKLSQWVTRSC